MIKFSEKQICVSCEISFEISRINRLKNIFVLVLYNIFWEILSKMYCKNAAHALFSNVLKQSMVKKSLFKTF